MPLPKRARACDICHSIKIKCELGSTGGEPPCQRCVRLGKECIVTPPVRQKDRVAELEAKLAALTKLLEEQQISVGESEGSTAGERSSESPAGNETAVERERSSKKRRRNSVSRHEKTDSGGNGDEIGQEELQIDHLMSRGLQKQLFNKYRHDMESVFPIASLAATQDYETLRRNEPVLLQAAIFASSQGYLSDDAQVDFTKAICELIAPEAIAKTEKSLALAQAALIIASWNRPPKKHVQMGLAQLIPLPTTLAMEVNAHKAYSPWSTGPLEGSENLIQVDAWRTWSACYVAAAGFAILRRLPETVPWTEDHDANLHGLEYLTDALPTDRLLVQLVRVQRLTDKIALRAGLYDNGPVVDVFDLCIMEGQNAITDWKAQLPPFTSSPVLEMYRHLASIILYEVVLHTPTNKLSFSAPFLAERLSVTDFPMPLVTPAHIQTLTRLRDACHALLQEFLMLDQRTMHALPSNFAARALYAQFCLVKLYIATTATNNTFGLFVDYRSLHVETYLGRLMIIADKYAKMMPDSGHAKILSSTPRLKEWLINYNVSHFTVSLSVPGDAACLSASDGNLSWDNTGIDWSNVLNVNSADNYGFEDLLGPG